MATDTWSVGASSDDCYRRLTTSLFELTDWSLYAGGPPSTSTSLHQYGSGMRFTGLTIPNGATITSAYLKVVCRLNKAGTVVNTKISAEDVDSAPTFADDADAFDTRYNNHTTEMVNWDAIPAWTAGIEYTSPNIGTVIKEIVDRTEWESGNDIVIFWEDFDDRSTHANYACRLADSYDRGLVSPKLEVTWEVEGVEHTHFSTDTLAISDSLVPALTMNVALQDTHAIGDSLGAPELTMNVALGDTLSMSDSLAALKILHHSASDTLSISDVLAAAATYNVDLADRLNMNDTLTSAVMEFKVAVADTLTMSDALAVAATYNVSVSDVLAISDALDVAATYNVAVSDVLIISDDLAAVLIEGEIVIVPRRKRGVPYGFKPARVANVGRIGV